MSSHSFADQSQGITTRLSHMGRDSAAHGGFVNVPVYRGSTILAESLEQWNSAKTADNPMH